jgi:pyruvate formate lyase activating enzyme
MISRRKMIRSIAQIGPMAAGAQIMGSGAFWDSLISDVLADDRLDDLIRSAPKARYWISAASAGADCVACHGTTPHEPDKSVSGHRHFVRCQLCAQNCSLRPGERGKCRARINLNGELRSLVYGRPVSTHVDPIEKKPFYHFVPGAQAFSFATSGCPLHCKFCQNWEISQSKPEDFATGFVPPQEIVTAAKARNSPIIAFTYNEPTVFTEYLTDIARLARKAGSRCVMISCGFMNEAPLTEICGLMAAIKVDLKGFDPAFYRNVCGAELKPVLRSIKQISRSGVHLEIVNLVVPTLNDSERMMEGLAEWVSGELGPDVPVHFTRFHPDYQLLNLSPTPILTLERAREIAMKRGIRYAYVGNVPGHSGNNTYCPNCGKVVIKRSNFFVEELNIESGKCRYCSTKIAGIWS